MTTRRDFLKKLGSGAVALVGVQFLSGCEELVFESKVAGAPLSFMTPAEDGSWYWQSGNGIAKDDAPDIAPEDWTLKIRNNGNRVGGVSFADLQALADNGESLSYWKTMRCVYGAYVGPAATTFVANGIFTGIPLHRVLEEAGVDPDANAKLRVFGADGFSSNIPIGRAFDAGPSPLAPLLAYELNGEPISRLRGGPVRLVIPETWGYKNVKWLDALEATPSDAIFGTYETERFNPQTNPSVSAETQRRIDDPGQISLASVVSDPNAVSATLKGPDVTIAGASFAGGQKIVDVQVALDDGPFESAQLKGYEEMLDALSPAQRELAAECAQQSEDWPFVGVWRTWTKTFSGLAPGDYIVTIRARDDAGQAQSGDTSQPLVIAPEVRVPFRVT
ncbi:twin-arginine translocation signal domain-containing protein [Persicimonas caeni]|uniref:Twin-arginine translocation signal domain-containing protein n=1 Tax=Persicimonas caeni TaxID=2292766 RepID=A0A4Y6PN37_PERCE|nr:molybdopterin-dependent oxidoreductase [Persicimonas caeni]QDG49712.1 twin-arginine translocation signal domain-containing protein [Persicimonas caeni]QED30933.1 molybdopterin-dependent oxidoreductase [Persicimonas caeni]